MNTLLLITGGNGWLGQQLIRNCLNGFEGLPDLTERLNKPNIRVLVTPEDPVNFSEEWMSRISIVRGDVTRIEDCRAFCANAEGAILIHTAGIIHPSRVSEFYSVNTMGTDHMAAAAMESRVKRMVHMSSNSPFGANPRVDHLFDEMSPYRPYMNYGKSKMQAEHRMDHWIQKGLDATIVRAPWFYGPYQPPRQSLFFKMIRQGKFPVVGSGENRRSMAYLDNLCQGLILAALVPQASGQAYWIADEQPYSMNEIVDTVKSLLQHDFSMSVSARTLRVPSIISDVARVADAMLQSVGSYNQKIHVLSEMNLTIACAIEKAKLQLGYRPLVDLREGMRRSIQWCLDQKIEI